MFKSNFSIKIKNQFFDKIDFLLFALFGYLVFFMIDSILFQNIEYQIKKKIFIFIGIFCFQATFFKRLLNYSIQKNTEIYTHFINATIRIIFTIIMFIYLLKNTEINEVTITLLIMFIYLSFLIFDILVTFIKLKLNSIN